jgi:hypothetical protein
LHCAALATVPRFFVVYLYKLLIPCACQEIRTHAVSSLDDEIRKKLLEALELMPGVIRSALLEKKKISATSALRWTELAVRLHRGPVDRALTDTDRKNAREAREILREAVPFLEKVQMGHKSERLGRKAAQYLQIIQPQTRGYPDKHSVSGNVKTTRKDESKISRRHSVQSSTICAFSLSTAARFEA